MKILFTKADMSNKCVAHIHIVSTLHINFIDKPQFYRSCVIIRDYIPYKQDKQLRFPKTNNFLSKSNFGIQTSLMLWICINVLKSSYLLGQMGRPDQNLKHIVHFVLS